MFMSEPASLSVMQQATGSNRKVIRVKGLTCPESCGRQGTPLHKSTGINVAKGKCVAAARSNTAIGCKANRVWRFAIVNCA